MLHIKKNTTMLIVLFLFSIIFSQTSITKDILCKTDWDDGYEFTRDGYYFGPSIGAIDAFLVIGRYEISGGKLFLEDWGEADENDKEGSKSYCKGPFKAKWSADYISSGNNEYRSSFFIQLKEIKGEEVDMLITQKSSGIPKGRLISIDNSVAVTLVDGEAYAVDAKTTSNLSLRATPSSQGKRLPWYTIEEINHGSESSYKYHGLSYCSLSYLKTKTEDLKLTNLAYIPESTSLGAIARTYYKDTINGVADYWYYVDADNSGYTINGEGWVWGEFLSVKE